jgi:hypothetical protein
MHRFLNLFLITIILVSCGNNNVKDNIKLSSLIEPEFSFNQSIIECKLLGKSSLLDLEFFFSKNIAKYKKITANKIKLFILFPENNINVNNFIINVISSIDDESLQILIEEIKNDSINKISACNFTVAKNKGLNIFNYQNNSDSDYTLIEILSCKYNQGYNYGTFQITINRFINHIKKLQIPFSLSYVQQFSNNTNFLWINSYHDQSYEKMLIDSWINSGDASEIKDEFIENATCIESSSYKSYQLL